MRRFIHGLAHGSEIAVAASAYVYFVGRAVRAGERKGALGTPY